MTIHKRQRRDFPSLFCRTLFIAFTAVCMSICAQAQTAAPAAVLFENVRVFNGTDKLSAPMNVLVVGNQITRLSSGPITPPEGTTLTKIDGGGRTLMPGLIDAHVHMMFNSLPPVGDHDQRHWLRESGCRQGGNRHAHAWLYQRARSGWSVLWPEEGDRSQFFPRAAYLAFGRDDLAERRPRRFPSSR